MNLFVYNFGPKPVAVDLDTVPAFADEDEDRFLIVLMGSTIRRFRLRAHTLYSDSDSGIGAIAGTFYMTENTFKTAAAAKARATATYGWKDRTPNTKTLRELLQTVIDNNADQIDTTGFQAAEALAAFFIWATTPAPTAQATPEVQQPRILKAPAGVDPAVWAALHDVNQIAFNTVRFYEFRRAYISTADVVIDAYRYSDIDDWRYEISVRELADSDRSRMLSSVLHNGQIGTYEWAKARTGIGRSIVSWLSDMASMNRRHADLADRFRNAYIEFNPAALRFSELWTPDSVYPVGSHFGPKEAPAAPEPIIEVEPAGDVNVVGFVTDGTGTDQIRAGLQMLSKTPEGPEKQRILANLGVVPPITKEEANMKDAPTGKGPSPEEVQEAIRLWQNELNQNAEAIGEVLVEPLNLVQTEKKIRQTLLADLKAAGVTAYLLAVAMLKTEARTSLMPDPIDAQAPSEQQRAILDRVVYFGRMARETVAEASENMKHFALAHAMHATFQIIGGDPPTGSWVAADILGRLLQYLTGRDAGTIALHLHIWGRLTGRDMTDQETRLFEAYRRLEAAAVADNLKEDR